MKSLTALCAPIFISLPLAAAEKPNIVVIVSDDQGYADASYNPYSPPEVSTPHLDALAAESVICTNGYTSGHVCSPTRAGIMTGRYQQRFGVYTAGEGGIRVPFTVSWPAQLKGGTTCDVAVWSTDIPPTMLAAAGLPLPTENPLDGKNMLPALKGETDKLHDHLFWRSGGDKGTWAVRSGKWKLTGVKGEKWLYNLNAELSESTDLSAEHPEVVAELQKAFDGWIAEMAEPLGGQPKVWREGAKPTKKKKPKVTKEEKDAEREKEREARRAAQKSNPASSPEIL